MAMPRICFINKINQTGGDFYKSLESIHNRLTSAFPVHLPIGFEQSQLTAWLTLVEMKVPHLQKFHDHELTVGEGPSRHDGPG